MRRESREVYRAIVCVAAAAAETLTAAPPCTTVSTLQRATAAAATPVACTRPTVELQEGNDEAGRGWQTSMGACLDPSRRPHTHNPGSQPDAHQNQQHAETGRVVKGEGVVGVLAGRSGGGGQGASSGLVRSVEGRRERPAEGDRGPAWAVRWTMCLGVGFFLNRVRVRRPKGVGEFILVERKEFFFCVVFGRKKASEKERRSGKR